MGSTWDREWPLGAHLHDATVMGVASDGAGAVEMRLELQRRAGPVPAILRLSGVDRLRLEEAGACGDRSLVGDILIFTKDDPPRAGARARKRPDRPRFIPARNRDIVGPAAHRPGRWRPLRPGPPGDHDHGG